MAARSIASLTLGFGLVSIPVKVYSATESAGTIHFNLLTRDGGRLKQQYVSVKTQEVVERAEMVKGYEFEKDRFVLFTPDELKALEEGASHSIDIVSFIPEKAVDPLYFDKAYFLAPDKRGGKPYALLRAAMLESGRCALATWAWKGRQHVVQVRAAEDGLVLQQLLFASEVRSMRDLGIESVPVAQGELKLALQLVDQIAADSYDPEAWQDTEKNRILAAIDEKIAGRQIVAAEHPEDTAGAQVIDLMAALQASLGARHTGRKAPAGAKAAAAETVELAAQPRKGVRRAAAKPAPAAEPAPVRARARK